MSLVLSGDGSITGLSAGGLPDASITAAELANGIITRAKVSTSEADSFAFCRAWVNFNGTGTIAIREDFNVSSITDNGGNGNYNVNFANNMPDANYSVTASHSIDFVLRVDSYATSTFRVVCNATTTDAGTVSVAVFR